MYIYVCVHTQEYVYVYLHVCVRRTCNVHTGYLWQKIKEIYVMYVKETSVTYWCKTDVCNVLSETYIMSQVSCVHKIHVFYIQDLCTNIHWYLWHTCNIHTGYLQKYLCTCAYIYMYIYICTHVCIYDIHIKKSQAARHFRSPGTATPYVLV